MNATRFMKYLVGAVILLAASESFSQQIEWNLSDVSYAAAEEVLNLHIQGGDAAVIAAIKRCHAGILDKTVFGPASMRCLTMDITGTLMAYHVKKTSGKDKVDEFYTKDGGYINRGMLYLTSLSQQDGQTAVQIIRKNILEALPALNDTIVKQ